VRERHPRAHTRRQERWPHQRRGNLWWRRWVDADGSAAFCLARHPRYTPPLTCSVCPVM
jgi:hypothetical protein